MTYEKPLPTLVPLRLAQLELSIRTDKILQRLSTQTTPRLGGPHPAIFLLTLATNENKNSIERKFLVAVKY
jgi:hypothetical protein